MLCPLRCGILSYNSAAGRLKTVKDNETSLMRKLEVEERVCDVRKSVDVQNEQTFKVGTFLGK